MIGTAALLLTSAVPVACGSSGGSKGTAPTASTQPASVTTVRGANPNAPEAAPPGDIPDNQAFVKYSPRSGAYSLEVPEGWARTEAGAATTFTDHYNSIRIAVAQLPAAPTVANVQSSGVPALQHSVDGFSLGRVSLVTRPAGPVVLVAYGATSAPDPVTGKRVALDVEQYEYWRDGTQVTLTLSSAHGADNVDPWKRVTESFAWSA